jgi:hypothetical protein
MPTYEVRWRFWSDYDRLNPRQRVRFHQARRECVRVLNHYESRAPEPWLMGESRMPTCEAHT